MDGTPHSYVDDNSDEVVHENEPASNRADETEKSPMTGEELAELRAELHLRQKTAMALPKLYLTVDGLAQSADQSVPCSEGLFVFDVQHLLLYAIQGGAASYKPRWCKLLRHTKLSHIVVVVVEAVGATDFATFSECFQFLRDQFPMNVELNCPSLYGQTVAFELFRVPFSVRRMKRMKPTTVDGENQPLEIADTTEADASDVLPAKRRRVDSVPVSRVSLLLSREQMASDGYPLPDSQSEKTKNYVHTKDVYDPVTESSPLFAIDCEMCQTESGANELARVAVINEQRECVYQTLVKPRNKITNYLTPYSGITQKMLKKVHTRIEEVQQRIQQLLPSDAILVGHSLNFDLVALQLIHPYVIDTAVCLHQSVNCGYKQSLKNLAFRILGRKIQTDRSTGHDPCEDALAALDLVLHGLQNGTSCENGSLPIDQNNQTSVSSKVDVSEIEVVSVADQPHIESDENLNASASSEHRSNETTAGAAFRCQPGTEYYESFGDVVKNANKTMAVIGFGSSGDCCSGDAVEHIAAGSNRSVVERCLDAVSRHFVVCAQLPDVRKEYQQHTCTGQASSSSSGLQTLLRKTDKRLRKLISSLKPQTLAVVLFDGGSRGDAEANQNAMCFVRVT